MRSAVLFVLLTLYQPTAGQEPRAIVTGPKESRPGSLVVLDATESQGLGRVWLLAVSPEPTSFLPVESGLKMIFASPTPGDYVFVLVVSGTNANGGPMAAMATHTVRLLAPNPPPEPPTIPPVRPPTEPPATDPTKPPLTTKPTAAVYVYEKDRGTVPPAVTTALHRLNTERESFVASAVDQDVTTGSGDVPAQFAPAIAAAKSAGLPALVVLSGSAVVRVVADPKTEAVVLEAVP